MRPTLVALTLLAACAQQRTAEDPDGWYDPGADLDVEEAIAFTTEAYDFPSSTADGIAALGRSSAPGTVFPAPRFKIAMGPGDFAHAPTGSGCDYASDPDLPTEIEGIVTLHPRYYFKTDGCLRDSDEKFYGSYFVQDRTGGLFVLGDSKVAHFDMGDRVRLKLRGVRSSFDLDMVYAHDVVEVERGPFPIYYTVQQGAMALPDIGLTRRITGEVVAGPDTFGQFPVRPEDEFGPCEADPTQQTGCWFVQLDSELNRRGVSVEPGDTVQATGPVLYSYSIFSVVVMRLGQLEVL